MTHATADRFAHALSALGTERIPHGLAQDLLARWSEPHRHYHDIAHLETCLAGLDAHRHLAPHPAAVEVALWFHDAIYDPRAPDNEDRSAAFAMASLHAAGIADAHAQSIGRLILATRTHEETNDADSALMLDLDLAVLGAAHADYQTYAAAIRREYAWVPETDYRHKRAIVLTRFLERPRIYRNASFFTRLESAARANLETEIRRLKTAPDAR